MKIFLNHIIISLLFFGTTAAHAQECIPLIYSSPIEGSKYVPHNGHIILRFKSCVDQYEINQDNFFLAGSKSGVHEYDITRINDGVTTILAPTTPFIPKESIQLDILEFEGSNVCESLNFTISANPINENGEEYANPNKVEPENENIQKSSHDSIWKFPSIQTINYADTDEGVVFVTVGSGMGFGGFLMIIDNYGEVLYWDEDSPYDFKKIEDNKLSYYSGYSGHFAILDSCYNKVDSFECDGYYTDFHEIEFLENGNALLLCSDTQLTDMSKIVAGGDTAAIVYGELIQEIDVNTKQAVFSWSTFDHFEVTDNKHRASMTAKNIVYTHCNAIEIDNDDNLLLSIRRFDEITKVNKTTGDIMWRLGGHQNEFEFINDTAMFCFQHDMRRLPNGNITIYDNAGFTGNPPRALEYKIDTAAMTATVVWEQKHHAVSSSSSMGNFQRLPNGNSLICWGTVWGEFPNVSEYDSDGNLLWELFLDEVDSRDSYRAYRYPWNDYCLVNILDRVNPNSFLLMNYPNPFTSSTAITFNVNTATQVKVTLTNVEGKEIAVLLDEFTAAGVKTIEYNNADLQRGIYFYTLYMDEEKHTRKMVKE